MNNSEDENKQSSNTNNKSLQPIYKENVDSEETNEEGNVIDSDKKENSDNPQQNKITSSDATIMIQKSESSKTKADEAESDKVRKNTSFQPINIRKIVCYINKY